MPSASDAPSLDILCPDLAGNAVGRAVVFAEMLRDTHRVRLIGPSSAGIWTPLRDRTDLDVVSSGRLGWRSPEQTAALVRAPVVLAIKPLLTSFGAALGIRPRRATILDVDDPEVELLTADWRALVRTSTSPLGLLPTLSLQPSIRGATCITVAGRSLQRRYGGTIVPHTRDATLFTPQVRDRSAARACLGIPPHDRVVVFVGTPRRHKGIDLLGRAAAEIAPGRLYVVGAGPSSPPVPAPAIAVPPLDYRGALRWVSAADVVVVPQLPGRVSNFQVPAKLSDALGVGRALVATDLEPIRDVVGNAAVLISPRELRSIGTVLRELLRDEDRRGRLEWTARARFEAHLTHAAVRPRVLAIIAEAFSAAQSAATA